MPKDDNLEIDEGNYGVAKDQLKAIVERIERLLEERDGINGDIKEIYAEAKGNGFDTKVMRKVIADRRKDREELREFEGVLEIYRAILGLD